jgi:hypothetical protein
MSYGQVDRLSDAFWTENELSQMHKAVINPSRYDKTPKHMCWYHLLKEGEYTGKAMLLAVESIVDGQDAVNNALADVGLTCAIGEFGDESVFAAQKVQMLYLLLEKYQYIGKISFIGDDKVFSYEECMAKLV